jgi:hypothetical protein
MAPARRALVEYCQDVVVPVMVIHLKIVDEPS